jgi:hypothetical protein
MDWSVLILAMPFGLVAIAGFVSLIRSGEL